MSQIEDFLSDKPSSQPKSGGDIDSFLSDAPKSYGLKDFGGDLASVVAKGVMAVPQAAVGLADIATGGRAGKALEDAGVRFKEANQIADSWKSDALKAQQKEFQDAEGIGGKAVAALSNPGLIASTVAESIPSMFLGGALAKGAGMAIPALAGRAGLAAAGEGAVMAGSQAENIRQQTADGLLTPGQSALAAVTGVAGGAIGALGARAGKALGVGDIDSMIANGAAQGAREGVGLAGRVGRGALAEGALEELPQSLTETAFGNIALDKPVTEGMDEAAVLGTLSGGLMGGVAGGLSRPAKPSQQMGIDPDAGPLSRAAASAVDSQPSAGGMGFNPDAGATTVFPDGSQSMNSEMPAGSTVGGSITGTAPESLMGRASDPLAAQIMARRQQEAVESPAATQSAPIPLEQRSLDELRQAFRSAQDPAIRKTLAAEIRKRREAMPDPLAQPQQEISLEPQAVETQQGSEKEQKPSTDTGSTGVLQQPVEQATEQATKELGQPLTDTGTNMLGRGADPLQSIIQGQADARRAADELRGTTGASTVTRGDITPPSVESPLADVRSGGRINDAGTAQPDATGDAGGAVGSAAQGSAALRPDNWRGNAIKAGKVARSLGLDPKGKRLKEIVAEIDAKDAGSGVAAKPVSREQAIRDAWRKEPRTIGKWTPISVEAEGQKADMLVNQKRAGGDKDGALHVVNIRIGKMLKDMEREPIAYTFRLTADNRLVEEGIPTVATPGQIAAWKGAGFTLDDKPANVQNTPSSTAGTEAQASPVEARAPEGGNAAADTGVPAAGGNDGVRADGVSKKQVFNIGGRDPYTVMFEHKDDGRLIRTITYPDGQVNTETLVTDRNGDESWVSQSAYEKGEFYPAQLSDAEASTAIRDDISGKVVEPTAPKAGDVQADGVNLSKNPRELNTSAEPVQKTSKNEQVAQAKNEAPAENKFAEYDALARQYGYEVRPDGSIGSDGKFPGVTMSVKKGRLRIEGKNGNLLGSYAPAPESLGKFLKSFWYAEKKTANEKKPAELPMPSRDDPFFDQKNAIRQLQNTINSGVDPQGGPLREERREGYEKRIKALQDEIAQAEKPSEQVNPEPSKAAQPKSEPDYLKELFGVDAEAIDADPFAVLGAAVEKSAGQKAKDIARIRESIKTEKSRAKADYDDWAGRVYKRNKTQVDLRGDGPSNQASMSVGAINESRRRNAMEALNKELTELDKLEKAVSTDEGAARVIGRLNNLMGMAQKAVDTGTSTFKTVDDQFQYMLLDSLNFRGPGGKGNITSNGLSKAMLDAVRAQPKAEKPAEDDAFMGVKKDEPRNLVAMHNLTADNLLYADSIGGIPVPSIGITKIDSPFNGFGDVTLIAPSSMVDPEQGTPVFDRDAWTARFPEMNFKKVKAKVADAFYERMKPADGMGDDGRQFMSMLWEEMRNASVQRPDKIADLFRRYNAPKMVYAKEVLGKDIKVPMRPAMLSNDFAADKQLLSFWKKNGDNLIKLQRNMSGPDFYGSDAMRQFSEEVKSAINRAWSDSERNEQSLANLRGMYIKEMFGSDGLLYPSDFNKLVRDFDLVGTKEVDRIKLSEAVKKAVPDNDTVYDRWVKSLVEPLFEAPTITVRGREVEPTLENIVDAMTVGATAGAEKSLTFGPGKTAAMLGKRFKSMAEIKADRDRVVSQDQESEGKKATEAILDQYRAKATAFFKGTDWRGNIDTWAANDASMEALAKAGKAGGSNADIRQALVRAGFKQVDQTTVDLASESIKALRNASTDYFEAKPQRAVKLSEFRAAVVPKGVSQEVKDVLTKNGIEVVEYNKKTEGARDAAIQKTAKRVDKAAKDILFMGDKAKAQRQGTPVDRAIMDMAGEGREANEILSFIAKSSKSPYRRQLAQKLLATGANPAVSLGGEMGGGAGFRFLAKYSRKNHEVTLSEAAADRAEQIFLHETVHSATLLALDKGGLIATQMNRLYESVKAQGGADGQYGLKNLGEFVAEAFTNPDFQKFLKGMKADNGSLWDRLVNIVRRILGMEPNQQDALSAALDLGAKVMRENMPLRAARSFRAEDGPAFAGSMNGMPDNQAPGLQGDAQQGADKGNAVAKSVVYKDDLPPELEGSLRLFHGGSGDSASGQDFEVVPSGGNFDGFFASANERKSWGAHGSGHDYFMDIPIEKVLSNYQLNYEIPYDQTLAAFEKFTGISEGDPGFDAAWTAVIEDKSEAVLDELLDAFGMNDFGEAGWLAQKYRGQVARELGFSAVEMSDEHGTSYLVVPGVRVIRAYSRNDQSAPDTDGADDAFFGIADAVEQIGKQAAVKPVVQALNDTFKVRGKIHWWHKTVGTPFNLAERVPEFKRVFNSVQDFINSVSFYGAEAAAMAPKIIPKLDSWKDLGKSPIKAEDNKAIATPIFEGTLSWRRGKNGTPVRTDDVGDAGIVWMDDELRSMFKLNDEQIGLYREFRAATDKSLTDLALSDILQFAGKDAEPIKDTVMGMSLKEGSETVSRYLKSLAEGEDKVRKAMLFDTANSIKEKADKAQSLMDRGYAPLQRFGRHTLYATNDKGEQLFFGMYEDRWAAARAARQMREQYPGAKVEVGMMSEQSYKLFQGISPETLELFGTMLGLDPQADGKTNEAFQTYLKLAKSNRSALKRLIERKGISGYSEDASRVLASFIYSNARQTASNLHVGEIMNGVNDIPRDMGEAKDAAVKLARYTMDPQEEAQALRGLLFAQYLGGSIASAAINALQPAQVTFPYLSQFVGAKKSASLMTGAVRDALKKSTGDPRLDAELKKAEEEGIVSPQEIFQLMAQAQGKATLKAGDGTKAGDAMAAASNTLSRLSLGWGKVFSIPEQFNRRTTFIAAYRTAKETGEANPYEFAKQVVKETQLVYNKGNRPEWARGTIGALAFTFKTYSISYVELLQRMAASGPEGRRAALLMVGVLFIMAGAGGLPGVEDAEDVVDGIAQRVFGLNFQTRQKRQEWLADTFGEGGARFIENGLSGLPWSPTDVSGRLGLGNLIPGTGLFVKKENYGRDVAEIAGPAADMTKRFLEGAGLLLQGEVLKAGEIVSPTAVRNMIQGGRMLATDQYTDTKGRKVIDTTPAEGITKMIGFQPADVARVQEATGTMQRMIALNKIRESEIADKWAKGLASGDAEQVKEARDELRKWNESNPESPIRINMPQLFRRVRALKEDKATRIARTAPKEIRQDVRRALEQGQ